MKENKNNKKNWKEKGFDYSEKYLNDDSKSILRKYITLLEKTEETMEKLHSERLSNSQYHEMIDMIEDDFRQLSTIISDRLSEQDARILLLSQENEWLRLWLGESREETKKIEEKIQNPEKKGRPGRPSKRSEFYKKAIRSEYAKGKTVSTLSRQFGYSKRQIYRIIKTEEEK